MKKGLLFINLGTPSTPEIKGVRLFLNQFLSDPMVINLPGQLRYLLLHLYILPFRSKLTAKAYQAIWTSRGSPLLLNSFKFLEKIQLEFSKNYIFALGMRYGSPSLEEALNSLESCESLTILPLYPQYSSAASGSSILKALELINKHYAFSSVKIIQSFYQHPAYIEALAAKIKSQFSHDYLLFSYHGIPQNQIQAPCKGSCLSKDSCLQNLYNNCYRRQCIITSEKVAQSLNLSNKLYSSSFQSRLGKAQWLRPYTLDTLVELRKQGINNLAVVCPSFVADCLETLEEIAIKAKDFWISIGGQGFSLIPCLNDDELWIKAVKKIVDSE